MFKVEEGEIYSEKKIRKGLEAAREAYGTGGYWEFTGYPDLHPRDQVDPNLPEDQRPKGPQKAPDGSPIVDVVMKMQEGEQYFVNRVTFVGNTTTRDNVIRREVRLLEGGVFNTEAMKYSLKRINQLGLLQADRADARQPEGREDARREEQGRRHAEVRRAEPEPDQFRRRRLAVRGVLRPAVVPDLQLPGPRRERDLRASSPAAARRTTSSPSPSRSCSIGPITTGVDLFKRELEYPYAYTQASEGGNVVFGFPVKRLHARVLHLQPRAGAGEGRQPGVPAAGRHQPEPVPGRRAAARRKRPPHDQPGDAEHRPQHDRQPDLPDAGHAPDGHDGFRGPRRQRELHQADARGRLDDAASTDVRAGESAARSPTSSRTAAPGCCPIFEKLFLGGEYSVRGYDIRSIGPRDPITGIVIGGDRSLLFNAEYVINIAGPRAPRALLRRGPGARRRGRTSRGTSGRRPPGLKCGSSCRC